MKKQKDLLGRTMKSHAELALTTQNNKSISRETIELISLSVADMRRRLE